MMPVRHSRWVTYWLALSYLVAGWGTLLHTHVSGLSGHAPHSGHVAGCCGECPTAAGHTHHNHASHAGHTHSADESAAAHSPAVCEVDEAGCQDAPCEEPGIRATGGLHDCTGCVVCHFLSQTGTSAGFQVVLEGASPVDYQRGWSARQSPAPRGVECWARGPPLCS